MFAALRVADQPLNVLFTYDKKSGGFVDGLCDRTPGRCRECGGLGTSEGQSSCEDDVMTMEWAVRVAGLCDMSYTDGDRLLDADEPFLKVQSADLNCLQEHLASSTS